MMFTFATIQAVGAEDFLVSPTGETVPFVRRAILFQKLVGMTPVEFTRQYRATPEDVLISHGYLYVNGEVVQVEGTPLGVAREVRPLLMAYLKTLSDRERVELMVLAHNPETYELQSETPYFQGSPRQLETRLLGAPDMSGFHSGFDTQVPYTYVKQKGGRPASDAPSKSVQNFGLSLEDPSRLPFAGKQSARAFGFQAVAEGLTMDMEGRDPRAPQEITLIPGRTHYGLPMVMFDSWEMALATDRMADKAVYASIMDSLWAFRTEFLLSYMPRGVNMEMLKAIKDQYEAGNEVIKSWLRNKQQFVRDAVASDGRGHFMSTYDGAEHELQAYYLRVQDLPKEVLRALRITRGATEDVYVYEINH